MAVTYGLSDSGFVARRSATVLAEIRDYIEAETGETFDWQYDIFWNVVTAAMAQQVGQIEQSLQAVYDAFDPNNSTGLQLDIIGAIRGIARNDATYSTATVTITGDNGTFIGAGKTVKGGGNDGEALWDLTQDVTIPSGGTVDVVVQAQEAGAVTADPDDIDTIVTPVTGWDSVKNSASATAGQARETDDEYRLRQEQSLQVSGSTSAAAILAALLDLDYITAAVVLDNDTNASATINGVTVSAHSIAVILLPSTLTSAQGDEVAETIFDNLAAGTGTDGTVTRAVTINALNSKTIAWEYGADLTVNVATTVELDSGYVLADVEDDIKAGISDLFDALSLADDVHDSDCEKVAMGVTGVKRVVCTVNGGTSVTPNAGQRPVLGTNTVST